MAKEKGKGIMDKGPGDAQIEGKDKPKVPSWRGESGTSDAKGSEETDSVHYDR
jgi:hypothetical protein